MNIIETFKTLLPGVEVSEDFINKLTSSIELTVAKRVDEETNKIKEEAAAQIAESKKEILEINEKAKAYAEYVVEEMTKKVNDYCEFVVEQFVEDNKVRLVETEEYIRTCNALRTIREVFESNYFQLNSEPANQTLQNKLQESTSNYNKLFEQFRSLKADFEKLKNEAIEEKKEVIFNKLTESLADTQKDRLNKVLSKTNFTTIELYEEGLKLMIEEVKAVKTEAKQESSNSNVTESSSPALVTEKNDSEFIKSYLKIFN